MQWRRGIGLTLYKANIRLSKELFAVIGLFEVVLRNLIDRHFIGIKGETWLEDAVAEGGYLNIPECENAFHCVHEAIKYEIQRHFLLPPEDQHPSQQDRPS